jgi:hypothetical protein
MKNEDTHPAKGYKGGLSSIIRIWRDYKNRKDS